MQMQQNTPLISVVMPVYNTGVYLRDAIDSVLAQTYRNWELIIVDDGSTDESPAILQSYSDERIHVLRQDNAGQSAARNKAMEVAKGEYVYFIDSDDSIAPTLFETCIQHVGQNDFLFFDADTIGDEASPWQTYQMASLFEDGKEISGAYALEESIRQYQWRSPVWLLFIRRSYIDGIALSFHPGIIHEDELYTGTLFARSQHCAPMAGILVHHRIRRGSTMGLRFTLRNMMGYATSCRELVRCAHPATIHLAAYTINNVLLTAKQMPRRDRYSALLMLWQNDLLRYCSLKNLLKML